MVDKLPDNVIDTALYWAERGIPVFPCGPNKAPLTTNGFYDAETDPVKVRKLFEFYQNAALVGGRMGDGIFAVDVDLYKGDGVKAWLKSRIDEGSIVDTRVHETMSGGKHFFYEGDADCTNPVDGVEIKGNGGYVIMADGDKYSVLSEGMVEAPASLMDAIRFSVTRTKGSTLAQLKASVLNGSDFHASLTQISAKLAASGMDQVEIQTEIMSLLKASTAANPENERHHRWRNVMADTGGELSRMVASAYTKFNDDSATEEMAETLGAMMEPYIDAAEEVFTQLGNTDMEPEPAPVFDTLKWPFEGQGYFADEDLKIDDQNFILFPIFAENETAVLFAEPKTGKTALALTTALHIACGLDLGALKISGGGPCLYYALEGSRAIRLRIESWKKEVTKEGVKLPDRIPLYVIERHTNFSKEEQRATSAAQIIAANEYSKRFGQPLQVIYIDTLTKAMSGSDQNSVEDTSALFEIIGMVRDGGVTATIVFVHHKARTGNLRGSSNIEAEPDILLDVTKKNEIITMKIAKARSIEDGGSYSYVISGVDLGKTKQGHDLPGMFVKPLEGTDDIEEPADVQRIAQMRKAITQLGEKTGYTPTVDVVEQWTTLGLIDGKTVKGVKIPPSPQSAAVQEQLHTIAADAGGTIYGDHIIRPTTEGTQVVGFKVAIAKF